MSLPAYCMRGQVSEPGINSRRKQSGDKSPHSKFFALPVLFFAAILLAAAANAVLFAAPVKKTTEKKPAGAINGEITIRVTGDPAPADFLAPLVAEGLKGAVRLEPGAKYEFGKTVKSLINCDVKRGELKVFNMPVRIFGEGLAEVKGEAPVKIANLVLEDILDGGKFIASNSPEEIHGGGALLSGRMEPFSPLRIFVHHKNNSTKDLRFACFLRNEGAKTARIHIVKGRASVSKNEIRAGHFASMDFFKNLIRSRGTFATIPPGGEYKLLDEAFPPGNVISYLGEATLLSAATVDFSIRTMRSYQTDGSYLSTHSATKTLRPHGEFPRLTIESKGEFTIGGRWLYMPVGDVPVVSDDKKDTLYGNYGLLHVIDVTVKNPSAKEQKAMIYLRPSSGPASGSFVIDGEFVEVPFIKSSEPKFLKAVRVKPGEERRVKVLTMPEPGSYYPIQLVFGADAAAGNEQAKDNK